MPQPYLFTFFAIASVPFCRWPVPCPSYLVAGRGDFGCLPRSYIDLTSYLHNTNLRGKYVDTLPGYIPNLPKRSV
ncbi:hypothetical protein F4809DRAFT_607340 [Biscogniauxia mediterranea]|nr:hypothetical protein F4809DRAFT_607340 [Biscogniauxia mediterranea]